MKHKMRDNSLRLAKLFKQDPKIGPNSDATQIILTNFMDPKGPNQRSKNISSDALEKL